MNTTERRPSPSNTAARKRKQQDVVYTQPKAFNRKRFLLQLATVAAVVLALLFGMSIFFKVEEVLYGTVEEKRIRVYTYDFYTLKLPLGNKKQTKKE